MLWVRELGPITKEDWIIYLIGSKKGFIGVPGNLPRYRLILDLQQSTLATSKEEAVLKIDCFSKPIDVLYRTDVPHWPEEDFSVIDKDTNLKFQRVREFWPIRLCKILIRNIMGPFDIDHYRAVILDGRTGEKVLEAEGFCSWNTFMEKLTNDIKTNTN